MVVPFSAAGWRDEKSVLRSRRDLLARTPLLVGAAGHSSVGVRINHLSYFRGAVMLAHFAPRAVAPSEFTKVPASLASTP
jgi:hypothetical protein